MKDVMQEVDYAYYSERMVVLLGALTLSTKMSFFAVKMIF